MAGNDERVNAPGTDTDDSRAGTPHYYGPHQPGLGIPDDGDVQRPTPGVPADDQPDIDSLAVED